MIFVLQSERTSQLCRRRRRRTTTTTTRIAMKMACTLITTRQHNDLRHRATRGKGRPTVGNNLPMKTLACNVTRHFVASALTYKTTVRETKNKPSTRKQTPTRGTSKTLSSMGGANVHSFLCGWQRSRYKSNAQDIKHFSVLQRQRPSSALRTPRFCRRTAYCTLTSPI